MWRLVNRFSLLALLGAILLPVLVLGHVRFYSSRSRLPEQAHETARVPGLREPVEVFIDGLGIPTIEAGSPEDMWFAQGYIHARDRFFQMDLARRAATGRLAETFGQAAMVSDRKMRVLQIAATARQQMAALDEHDLQTVERYAAGVNAALAEYGRWIAPEVWMLGAEPEQWRVEDSLAIGLLVQLNLTWAMGDELARAVELAGLGKDVALDLWGWGPREIRSWIPPVEPPAEPRQENEAMTAVFGGGSNNWAIAPSRTATGRPLLANDPHVGVAMPGTWYGIGLRCPGIHVAGASIAGVPGVAIGHNETVAWGFTMSMMDDQDLFVLTLDDDHTRELIDGVWVPLRAVTEEIRVRWRSEPEIVKVKVSRNGPVVRERLEKSLALSWTAYAGKGALGAFLRMAEAKTAADIALAWEEVAGPSMNLVAADVDGHIMHQVVGREPIRRRGAGRLPAPGSDSAWAWEGLYPLARNPSVFDPKEGFVASANHDLFSEGDYPYGQAFPADFAAPWRIRRLRKLLAARTDWDVEDCLVVQADVVSGRAVALLKALWPDIEQHGGPTAEALLQWDGSMVGDDVAPHLFSLLILELARDIGEDEALAESLDGTPLNPDRVLRLLGGGISEDWWDNVRTDQAEDRAAIVARCLDTIDALQVRKTWGQVHRVVFDHPLHQLPLIGPVFRYAGSRGPLEVPGDGATLNAQYWDLNNPFEVNVIPSLRFVADVGDWDRSVLALPVGQSGRIWSSHYGNQVGDWLAVRARPMAFTPAAVARAARSRMTLTTE